MKNHKHIHEDYRMFGHDHLNPQPTTPRIPTEILYVKTFSLFIEMYHVRVIKDNRET